jgi:hypothetical protein
MTGLDDMTKAELLDEAEARGVEVDESMTKAEIREAIEEETGPEVVPQVTTTRTKDFLNRPLVNPTPGTSSATDYLGRSVVATDKDFLGRALVL